MIDCNLTFIYHKLLESLMLSFWIHFDIWAVQVT